MSSADDLKSVMGLYDASLGAQGNEMSGRMLLLRQKEGDVSNFHFADNLCRAIEHGGRILVDLIPTVYSGQRVVQVIGPEQSQPQPVQLGSPAGPVMDAQGQEVSRIYDLSVGEYGVTVEAGPSFTSRREEAANQMMDLIGAFPQAAPVIGDLLVKNLDWPGADEIARRLASMLPPQLQGGQAMVPAAQLEQLHQAAQHQIGQLNQQLQAAQAKIQAAQVNEAIQSRKNDIDEFEAQTKRLKAQADVQLNQERVQMGAPPEAL